MSNKLKELKAAAWAAHTAHVDAINSRNLAWLVCKPNSDNGITPTDSDWEAYRAADEVFMDARAASRRAEFDYKEYLEGINGN